MEKELESLLSWWDVSGVDIPDIKAAPRKKVKPTRATIRQAIEPAKPSTVAKPLPKDTASARADDSAALIETAKKLAQSAKTLQALQSAIADFDVGALSDGARQSVFSRGNPEAKIMVIGEAPGPDEDRQGKPFVGRSGELLDKIFASIGLDESSLYVTNIVNWHPRGNRNPTTEDIEICRPLIHRHIELIAPETIILVGSVSMTTLSDRKGITKSRGEWVDIDTGQHKCTGLIIYHPAYLLRQPHLKKETWRDMLALKNHLETDN